MDTDQLMALALDLAGQREVPADSQILVPGKDIRRVMVGIDVGEAEVLLAKQLRYDCVIAHHPCGGHASIDFHRILEKQFEFLRRAGVPEPVARAAADELITRADVGDHADNYDRTPAVARLLKMPLLNIHNPFDEVGRRIVDATVEGVARAAGSVGDGMRALEALPEMRKAVTRVKVRLGSKANPLGRHVVHMAAGTNGGYPVAKAYFDHGVDTVLYMHIIPEELKRLKEDQGMPRGKNLVVTGHMATDSLGITPYVERLRAKGLQVTCVGGIVEP